MVSPARTYINAHSDIQCLLYVTICKLDWILPCLLPQNEHIHSSVNWVLSLTEAANIRIPPHRTPHLNCHYVTM